MVQVLLLRQRLGQPFGHVNYHPIFFEAAVEPDLPDCHPRCGRASVGPAQVAAGGDRTRGWSSPWRYRLWPITSPAYQPWSLREVPRPAAGHRGGALWILRLAWRLDEHHAELRAENLNVKELPSEYIRRHRPVH